MPPIRRVKKKKQKTKNALRYANKNYQTSDSPITLLLFNRDAPHQISEACHFRGGSSTLPSRLSEIPPVIASIIVTSSGGERTEPWWTLTLIGTRSSIRCYTERIVLLRDKSF